MVLDENGTGIEDVTTEPPEQKAWVNCPDCVGGSTVDKLETTNYDENKDGSATYDVDCPECGHTIEDSLLAREPGMVAGEDADVFWKIIEEVALVDQFECWEFRELTVQKTQQLPSDDGLDDEVIVLGTGKSRSPQFSVSTYSTDGLWAKLTTMAEEAE
jgi:endogenous inhibitor of DNA gyrase (YacG/DUF329 family)